MIELVELAPLRKTFEDLAKAAAMNGHNDRAEQWEQAVQVLGTQPTIQFVSKELDSSDNKN